jgi:hypothetical protein
MDEFENRDLQPDRIDSQTAGFIAAQKQLFNSP